ncbi:hypothetical protein TNIN_269541 [Trichonephila inaurata madagascariensis]|uniref:Secreted protein n=1 Tax=Trichonephila inaurata madagascariensis TaxID=2747483 RepID=A0A8X7C408_9ARAC|nr:hypothetical protein TNIN_269541 [Trichonephila inaurata madagascariensis]
MMTAFSSIVLLSMVGIMSSSQTDVRRRMASIGIPLRVQFLSWWIPQSNLCMETTWSVPISTVLCARSHFEKTWYAQVLLCDAELHFYSLSTLL